MQRPVQDRRRTYGHKENYANNQANIFLERREDLSRCIEQLEHLQRGVASIEKNGSNLKLEVESLKARSLEFYVIRSRSFETFRQDVLQNTTPKSIKMIQKGNIFVNEGYVVVDSDLSLRGLCNDRELFVTLYGLTPSRSSHLACIPS